MACTLFEIYEKPQSGSPHESKPHVENPGVDNSHVENSHVDNPHVKNPGQSNTNISNTKESNTYSINHPSIKEESQYVSDGNDEIQSREKIEEIIKDNIDYEIITADKRCDKSKIDEIVALMLDAICSPSPTVRINGMNLPKSSVRERFLQLDSEHIEYVLFAMERSKPDVRNIRAYLFSINHFSPFD